MGHRWFGRAARSSTKVSARRPPQPVSLVRWFSLLTLASIAMATVASSVVLSRFLTQQMLKRDAEITMEFTQSVARVQNAAAYFQQRQPTPGDTAFEEFFTHVTLLPDVLRANIYSRDHTLLWSSDQNLMGQRFQQNPELDEALAGKLTVETGVTGKEQHPKQEHMFLGDKPVHFVESYIPVRDPNTHQVIGVVELYRIPHALFATIASGTKLIWLMATLTAAFLYISLFWIFRRGDRTIRLQQDRLIEAETMAAVGEMASAVAHGIRNPLASIRSSAELSLEESRAGSQAYARDIMHEVDRLEHWVRDLLTYSQPEGGSLIEAVSLPEIVARSLDRQHRDTERLGIRVKVDVPASLPPVQVDEALLEQAITNIFANAVDAMPKGGDLTVQAVVERRAVVLSVADSGIGIPADQIASVFTAFHTTKRTGLGVGLTLTKRILARFGGDITISSQEGRGTTVRLRLPVAG